MAFSDFFPTSLQPQQKQPARDAQSKMKLLWSYLPDWILAILIWALIYLVDRVYGFRREFSLTDTSIQHTYTQHERVSTAMLAVFAGIIPAVIIVIIALFLRRSFWDCHNGLLGLVLSLAVSTVVTTVVKVVVGRPRPDFIARCLPREGASNAAVFGLVTEAICTQTDPKVIRDGFRSFFSGHSSFSFAGLTFLALFLAGKLQLYDNRGLSIKTWIVLLPLLGALLIALTRSMDYRHHAGDIIAGSLVGLITAYHSYRAYYPSLHHPECYKPYSPRIPSSSVTIPGDSLPLPATATRNPITVQKAPFYVDNDVPSTSYNNNNNIPSAPSAHQREIHMDQHSNQQYQSGIDGTIDRVPGRN